MANDPRSLMILVAGPYRSGTGDDPHKLEANVRAMNESALVLFRAGHLPVTGEALALPLLDAAGSTRPGDPLFDEIFHPVAEQLLARCDAVLRIGGASRGRTGWSPGPAPRAWPSTPASPTSRPPDDRRPRHA